MATKVNVGKKKLENFWYYYKIHVIVGVFVVILLGMTLKDCASNVPPDATITYIGEHFIPSTSSEQLEHYLLQTEVIQDANEDGKIELFFQKLNVSDEIRSEQDMLIQQKIMLVFATGDPKIYLLDRLHFEIFAAQGAFVSLDHLVQKYNLDIAQNPEVKLAIQEIYSEEAEEEKDKRPQHEEHVYAFPLEDNTLLKDLGFDTQGMYIALGVERQRRRPRENEQIMHQNGYAILKEILKYN